MIIRRKRTPYLIMLIISSLLLGLGLFVNFKKNWAELSDDWLPLTVLSLAAAVSLYFTLRNIVKIRLERNTIYLDGHGTLPLSDLNSIFLEEISGYKGIKSKYLVFYFEKAGTIQVPYGNLAIDIETFDKELDNTTFDGEIGLEL